MKLIAYLSQLSTEQLQLMARTCGEKNPSSSKAQLLNRIVQLHQRGQVWQLIVNRLPESVRQLLRYLVHLPPQPITRQELQRFQHAGGSDDTPVEELLQSLFHLGVVMPEGTQDRRTWILPEDVHDRLSQYLEVGTGPQLASREFIPEQVFARGKRWLHDLATFLNYARESDLRLTQQEGIFRRSQQQISDLLLVSPPDPLVAALKLPDWWDQPVDLLHAFAEHTRLIERKQDRLKPTDRVDQWFVREDRALVDDWLRYCGQRVWRGDLRGRAIVRAMVGAPITDQWYSPNEIVGLYAPGSDLEHWPGWLGELVYVLANLGLVEIARQAGPPAQWAWRPTDRGHRYHQDLPLEPETTEPWWMVQPTFELITSAEIPLALRWQLDRLADFEQGESALTFRISKTSVYRALCMDQSAEDLIAFLETNSRKPLPQNVTMSITEWARAFGRLTFQKLLVLRCDSAPLAQELQHTPDVCDYIAGQLGEATLIVPEASFDQLHQALQDHGYLPRVDFDEE